MKFELVYRVPMTNKVTNAVHACRTKDSENWGEQDDLELFFKCFRMKRFTNLEIYNRASPQDVQGAPEKFPFMKKKTFLKWEIFWDSEAAP